MSLAARLKKSYRMKVQLLDGQWIIGTPDELTESEYEETASFIDGNLSEKPEFINITTHDGAQHWVPPHAVMRVVLEPTL